jgi:hypothetical protein
MSAFISAVVEGDTDAAVIRRLAAEASLEISTVHVKGGKQKVREWIGGYNAAARHHPFVVLVDLDQEFPCAPELLMDWLQHRERLLCLRVAVQAVEAWLLADRERAAQFFRVRKGNIQEEPDAIPDPKGVLVDVVRTSTSREIREDIVPREGSGRRVGAAYSSRLVEFVNSTNGWRPAVASEHSGSLARARDALRAFRAMLRSMT